MELDMRLDKLPDLLLDVANAAIHGDGSIREQVNPPVLIRFADGTDSNKVCVSLTKRQAKQLTAYHAFEFVKGLYQ